MIYQEIFDQLEILAPEIYEIFQIGRILQNNEIKDFSPVGALLKSNPEKKDEEKAEIDLHPENQVAQEWHVDVMQRLQDFPRVLKKEFLLPDGIFDHKLITKDLLVRQPDVLEEQLGWEDYFEQENKQSREKTARRQSTYLLIDVSGTTASHFRLLLEKAIAMQFLLNNSREKGTIYLRFFNHDVSKLVVSANGEKTKIFWSRLLQPVAAFGGTNLNKALLTAMDDLKFHGIDDETEILVLTDGLAFIDKSAIVSNEGNNKVNFVIIGSDRPNLTDSELRDLFEESVKKWKLKWESELDPSAFRSHLAELEKKFWSNRHKEQDNYYDQIQSDLKSIASETGGLFIEIPDLPQESLNSGELIKTLRKELKDMGQRLNESIPLSEKENILERLISLKNYVNSMVQANHKLPSQYRESLDNISEGLKNLITRDAELMEILKYAKIRVRFGSAQADQELTMADLFKILFYKFRSYFLRYKA